MTMNGIEHTKQLLLTVPNIIVNFNAFRTNYFILNYSMPYLKGNGSTATNTIEQTLIIEH